MNGKCREQGCCCFSYDENDEKGIDVCDCGHPHASHGSAALISLGSQLTADSTQQLAVALQKLEAAIQMFAKEQEAAEKKQDACLQVFVSWFYQLFRHTLSVKDIVALFAPCVYPVADIIESFCVSTSPVDELFSDECECPGWIPFRDISLPVFRHHEIVSARFAVSVPRKLAPDFKTEIARIASKNEIVGCAYVEDVSESKDRSPAAAVAALPKAASSTIAVICQGKRVFAYSFYKDIQKIAATALFTMVSDLLIANKLTLPSFSTFDAFAVGPPPEVEATLKLCLAPKAHESDCDGPSHVSAEATHSLSVSQQNM